MELTDRKVKARANFINFYADMNGAFPQPAESWNQSVLASLLEELLDKFIKKHFENFLPSLLSVICRSENSYVMHILFFHVRFWQN